MRKVLIGLSILLMIGNVNAQKSSKVKAKTSKFQYVGVKKCKICHNKAKTGKQYTIWQKQLHAKAYQNLASTTAKKYALKAGVKGDPQKAKECLVCHVTAFNASDEQKTATLTLEEGVSCEACHGPGSVYKSMKKMKDIREGKAKGTDFGLVKPTKELCVTCHNPKSPAYKEFNFDKAVKTIAHPVIALEQKK